MADDKDFDFSSFDEEVGQEDQLDFSDFDSEVDNQETKNELAAAGKSAAVGAGIFAGQKALEASGLSEKVKDLPMKALSSLGSLDSEQIKKIKNNPDLYRQSKDVADLVTETEDIERGLQQGIFDKSNTANQTIVKENVELPKNELKTKLDKVKGIQQYDVSENVTQANKKVNQKVRKLDKKIEPLKNDLESLSQAANTSKVANTEAINSIDGQINEIDRQLQTTTDKSTKDALNASKKDLQIAKRELTQKYKKNALDINKKQKSKIDKLKDLQKQYKGLSKAGESLPQGDKLNLPEIEKYVQSEQEFLSKIDSPKGEGAVNLLKRVRSDADYNKALGTESFSNKAAKQYGKDIRNILGEKSPTYDKLMKESSEAIKDRKDFASIIGLKGNTKTGEPLRATNTTAKRIEKLITDPESPDFKKLTEIAQKYELEDFMNKAELTAINKAVEDATGLKNIKLGDILKGTIAANVIGAGPAVGGTIAARQAIGTKAQELLTLASENPIVKGAGKVAGKVGKAVSKSLPLVGALGSYQEAQAAGMDPLETAGYVAAEELNPLPVSLKDMYDAKEDMNKADSNLLNERMANMFPKATEEARIENEQKKQEKAAKLKERLARYNEIKDREMMSLKSDEVNRVDKLKNLENVKSTIEKLKTMDTEASNSYANELQSVEGEDDQRKNAVLMGLMQQPAFRQMLKKMEKDDVDGEETN